MVRVLPLPAPAKTKSGPSKWATASFWGSFSSGIRHSRWHRAGAGARVVGWPRCKALHFSVVEASAGRELRAESRHVAHHGRGHGARFGLVVGGGLAVALAVAGRGRAGAVDRVLCAVALLGA